MRNKKVFFCLKVVAALVVTFIVLNLFCVLYYNLPAHNVSKTNSTDFVWGKNKFYSRGTEGFAWGVIDENGFNNLQIFQKGEIDVLMMGSSHMEGFNVAQDKNTTAVLNKMFKEAGKDLNAYSIAISGHGLPECLNGLENAIDEFAPQKYVVIETQVVANNLENLKKVLDGKLPRQEVSDGGIKSTLEKIPYIRLVYSQFSNAQNNKNEKDEKKEETDESKIREERKQVLDALLQRSARMCEKTDSKLIIVYNCELEFDENGHIMERENSEDVEVFKEVCEKNGGIFIDMAEPFIENYEKTNKLPRGFSNTEAGKGHINEEGHRVIAQELFSVICK